MCMEGCGTIRINDHFFDLQVGQFFFLPWHASFHIEANTHEGLHTLANHVIPHYTQEYGEVCWGVSHHPNDKQASNPFRSDKYIPELTGIISGTLTCSHNLFLLCQYIITWYQSDYRNEQEARVLGQLLINELIRVSTEKTDAQNMPTLIQESIAYIDNFINTLITQAELADHLHTSESTLSRAIRKHFGYSTGTLIKHRRCKQAQILLRTTYKPINEIAQAVGFQDIYYFSKQFKKLTHETPSQYRKSHLVL